MSDHYASSLSSLDSKCCQLIVARLDGDRIALQDYRDKTIDLVRKGIGGFILFGGKRGEMKEFIAHLQSHAPLPLFIASDIERGVGQQIAGATLFPSQMAVAAAIDRGRQEDLSLLHKAVMAIADEAKDLGINLPLIPVLDVNRNPDNPIICTRAFSDDIGDVAWFGSEYIRILEAAGLSSCAKHFPGHGDTSVDSHISLPVISKTREELLGTDVLPFIRAVDAGVSAIMVGHLRIPSIDSRPASLSKALIDDLLRRELGFNGLVLTDALNMDALKTIGDVYVQCLKAGADVLLHPADPDAAAREVRQAVETGHLDASTIEAALERIIILKRRFRGTEQPLPDYAAHAKLSEAMRDKSITLVKSAAGVLPLSASGATHLFIAGAAELFDTSALIEHFVTGTPQAPGDIALIAIFTAVSAWRGSSGIGEDERRRILHLMQKAGKSVVISFGSPYVLRHFSEADVLIAAYDQSEQTQRVVIKGLLGEMPFTGRLPVKLGQSLES